MNNPKHTKGPWHFIETGPIRKGGPKASLLANASPHIHGVCEGISDADARLIAAAPELLEALKKIDAALESIDRSRLTFTDRKIVDRVWSELLSTITKATGGSNE